MNAKYVRRTLLTYVPQEGEDRSDYQFHGKLLFVTVEYLPNCSLHPKISEHQLESLHMCCGYVVFRVVAICHLKGRVWITFQLASGLQRSSSTADLLM